MAPSYILSVSILRIQWSTILSSDFNYDEIRQRVEKRFKKRQEFITHFLAFVLGNIMVWTIYGLVGGGFPWPIFVTVGWAIGLVGHGYYYINDYGAGAQRREAEIQREIERERERSLAYEKPKRDPHFRLTDNGEIEEIYDDTTSMSETRKRG
ncbi:MAG: 2TM domain-containing protein [Anaerolineae bacterium]